MIPLFLLLFELRQAFGCSCDGVVLSLPDQDHCLEIIRGTGGSWVAADQRCASRGGFLAHFQNGLILSGTLLSYINQSYQNPLLTGATIGNIDTMRVALMCPNNQFHQLLNQTYVATYFTGTPTEDDRCTFWENTDSKFHYLSCDTNADILCDRPMQQVNYCNIMMNCTTTTAPPVVITTNAIVLTTTTTSISNINNSTVGGDKNCGKGYTRVFGWCVPWWAWLLFGLLLLLLLCCLLGWLLHCCCRICLKETVYIEKKYNRRHVEQQTDLEDVRETVPIVQTVVHQHKIIKQVPPPIIYDVTVYENNFNKEMIVPPAPYYPANNPSMLLPPPLEQDAISAESMSIYVENTPPTSPKRIIINNNHAHEPIIIEERATPLPTKDIPHAFPPPPPRDPSPEITPMERHYNAPPPSPPRPIRRHSFDAPPIVHRQPSSPVRSPFEMPDTSPEPLIIPPLPPVRRKKRPKPRSYSPTERHPKPMQEFSKQPIASSPRKFPPKPYSRRPLESSPPPLSKRRIANKPPIPSAFSRRPISKSPPRSLPRSPPKEASPKSPARNRRTPSEPRRRNNDEPIMQGPMKSPNGNVGIRGARGRLGGVAGGRLGNRPDGWKPWAKSPNVFSDHPGYLDVDG